MERIEQEHWYYTIDELGRFHNEGDEPAIVVNDYLDEKNEAVSWYRAWYNHWVMIRSERNSWEVFTNNEA